MPVRFAAVLLFTFTAVLGSASHAAADERLCDTAFENCRQPLLDLIANETVGIDVAFWFMEDSRYATALIDRWNAGVPVRVIIDTKANGAYPGNIRMLEMLAEAGIPMRERSADYLHWKLMLFAGQNTVQFSGANYSPNAFVPNQPYVDYVDEVIYFSDDPSVVNSFKTKYDDAWVQTSGFRNYANVSGTLTRSYPTYSIDPELNFPPEANFATRSAGRYNAEDQGIDSIIYRIDDDRHTNPIIAAIGRDVPVRILTEQEQYRDPVRLWHAYNIDRLHTAGAQIRLRGHQGLNHEKLTILREQRMTILGSSNWTRSSSNQQHEHNYFTTKTWIYNWARDHFERKWNNLGPAQESKPFEPLPPDAPSNRTPANAAQGLNTTVALKWWGGPWSHFYDVYFGTDPTNLQRVGTDLHLGPSESSSDTQSHTVSGLAAATTYYWRIVGKTAAGLSKAGPVWNFRTTGTPGTPSEGDVVLWARRATTIAGDWQRVADATAAGDQRLWNPSAGQAKPSSASAAPADYFELSFNAAAGVPYRLWVRGKAQNNSWQNDSVFVQFSDSVTSGGSAAYRIGTTSSLTVTIEEGANAGLSGWGWADQVFGGEGPPIYFATSGTHTVRIQRREDGISIDQIVLSSSSYLTTSPGFPKNDGTILPEAGGSSGGGDPDPDPDPEPTLPSGWSSADVGTVGQTGSAEYSGGTFTVRGAGADVWGTSDGFHFVYRTLAGDGQIVARVATLSGTDAWTKAGVMIRQSLSRDSAHGFMLVSKSKGIAFQRRTVQGGLSTHTSGGSGTAPRWVRLTRSGAVLTAEVSGNGSTWTLVDTDNIALSGTVLVGIAVTAHTTSQTATATFDGVTVTTGGTTPPDDEEPPDEEPPDDALPDGWVTTDVGPVGVSGSATEVDGTFTVKGAGADVWDRSDAFHYTYRTLSGDGAIVARVAALSGSEAWTKVGVMIRQSLAADSPHGFMLVSKSKGLAFQRRTVAGGESTHTSGGSGTAPRWVRISRAGQVVTASVSSNGSTWTVVDTDVLDLNGSVLIGLAVTAHTTSSAATGTLDHVTITP